MWTEYLQCPEPFEASDFNALIGNQEYLAAALSSVTGDSVSITIPTASILTQFAAMRGLFDNFASNMAELLSHGYTVQGYTPVTIGDYEPSAADWGTWITALNNLKAQIEAQIVYAKDRNLEFARSNGELARASEV